MAEGIINDSINTTELLMNISKDIAVIKNDMQHLKEEVNSSNAATSKRLCSLEKEVANIKSNITELENKDDLDAVKKYRKIIVYICTAVAGMFVARLPEIIKAIINVFRS